MSRNKLGVVIMLWVGAISGGMLWHAWQARSHHESGGPKTIQEASDRCRDAGLFFTSRPSFDKSEFNTFTSFTVCSRQIDYVEVNCLTAISNLEKWKGIARIYGKPLEHDYPDHLKLAQWGNVYVLGDPEFVDKLLAMR